MFNSLDWYVGVDVVGVGGGGRPKTRYKAKQNQCDRMVQ